MCGYNKEGSVKYLKYGRERKLSTHMISFSNLVVFEIQFLVDGLDMENLWARDLLRLELTEVSRGVGETDRQGEET